MPLPIVELLIIFVGLLMIMFLVEHDFKQAKVKQLNKHIAGQLVQLGGLIADLGALQETNQINYIIQAFDRTMKNVPMKDISNIRETVYELDQLILQAQRILEKV